MPRHVKRATYWAIYDACLLILNCVMLAVAIREYVPVMATIAIVVHGAGIVFFAAVFCYQMNIIQKEYL